MTNRSASDVLRAASPVDARLSAGEDVALVDGGNAAGQAAAFLAPRAKALIWSSAARGLEATMSRDPIEHIADLPEFTIQT